MLPPSKPRSLGSTHFVLEKPQTPIMCTPPIGPRLLGSMQFGTFERPNSQKVYSQLLPPSKPRSLGSTHFGTRKRPKCQNVYSFCLQALVCMPGRHMLPAALPQIKSCIDSNACSELAGIAPNPSHCEKQPVVVRENMSWHPILADNPFKSPS